MRVGVYIGKQHPEIGGGFTFQDNLIEELLTYNGEHDFYFFYLGDNKDYNARKHFISVDEQVRLDIGLSPISLALLKNKIDVCWFLSTIAEDVHIPFIYTLWDLEHRKQPFFPEVSQTGWDWERREDHYQTFLRKASTIITGTERGREEIHNFYGVIYERINVIPFPTPNWVFNYKDSHAVPRCDMPHPFLFYPAQFWPHKNHITLLRALKILVEKYSYNFHLVFTGSDMGNQHYIQEETERLGLLDRVIFMGFVTRDTLASLYTNAFALVYPSFLGPDNFPPLEAFAFGCPVLAATILGSHEHIKKAAVLFDPKKDYELAEKIKELYLNANLREHHIQAGLQYSSQWKTKDYLNEVISILDDFVSYRRCWSSETLYRHFIPGEQMSHSTIDDIYSTLEAQQFRIKSLRERNEQLENDRQQLENTQQQLKNTQQQLEYAQQQLENNRQQFENTQQQLGNAQQQLEYTQQQLLKTQKQFNDINAYRFGLEDTINRFQTANTYLHTFTGAFKLLAMIASKKIGVYNHLKRHERIFRRIHNFLPKRPSMSPTEPINEASAPVLPIHSPSVNALIVARGLNGNMDERSLVDCYELGSSLHNILCLQPTEIAIQALYMLSQAGANVTCLNWHRNLGEKQPYGFTIYHGQIDKWMISTGLKTLTDYDCILLTQPDDLETMTIVKGRLSANTRILLTGNVPSQQHSVMEGKSADRTIGPFELYYTPPETWLDPIPKELLSWVTDDWLLRSFSVKAQTIMPSGRPWPKISIVTVTYNQGAYLEETIRSVLLQGYPNLEYIVIDGGSTDNTSVILNRYRNELSYCISEPDKGQSDALNKGFRLAAGDILAWLNSDDRYMPWTLWRVAQYFDSVDTDMVAGGCALVQGENDNPVLIHHNAMPVGKVVQLPLEELLDVDGSWQKGTFFYQPEVFWSRSIWQRSGALVDESLFYSMDYELWLRMAQSGARILHIPDTLAKFRIHQNQKTSGDLPFLPELRRVNADFKRNI